jgi:hypothetical protein
LKNAHKLEKKMEHDKKHVLMNTKKHTQANMTSRPTDDTSSKQLSLSSKPIRLFISLAQNLMILSQPNNKKARVKGENCHSTTMMYNKTAKVSTWTHIICHLGK